MFFDEKPHMTTDLRPLVIENSHFTFGNIEAWINILKSYQSTFPDHKVMLIYNGVPVNNLANLHKQVHNLNLERFELKVSGEDMNRKNVSKLRRLLMEGGGPNFKPFINRELYKVTQLFDAGSQGR